MNAHEQVHHCNFLTSSSVSEQLLPQGVQHCISRWFHLRRTVVFRWFYIPKHSRGLFVNSNGVRVRGETAFEFESTIIFTLNYVSFWDYKKSSCKTVVLFTWQSIMECILSKLYIRTVTPRISRFNSVRPISHNFFRGPTYVCFYNMVVVGLKGRIYFVLRYNLFLH